MKYFKSNGKDLVYYILVIRDNIIDDDEYTEEILEEGYYITDENPKTIFKTIVDDFVKKYDGELYIEISKMDFTDTPVCYYEKGFYYNCILN